MFTQKRQTLPNINTPCESSI